MTLPDNETPDDLRVSVDRHGVVRIEGGGPPPFPEPDDEAELAKVRRYYEQLDCTEGPIE